MISLTQGRTASLYNMICRQFCINEMTSDPNQSCQNNLSEFLLLWMHLKSVQVFCTYNELLIND